MAEFDATSRRLTLKLVYYGPALSGKTTNLMRLHDMLRPELKGEMMTLETRNDRTLFFDLLPLGFRTPTDLLVKLSCLPCPARSLMTALARRYCRAPTASKMSPIRSVRRERTIPKRSRTTPTTFNGWVSISIPCRWLFNSISVIWLTW